MTEEEIQALQEAKEAAETRAAEAAAAAEAARAEADKAKSDLSGVVEELTEERKKKNEALEKLKVNNPNPTPLGDTGNLSEVIQREFEKRDQERIKSELESAIAEFRSSKTEFQADSAGLVFDKFKKELAKFNFSDVTSKEQAKQRLEEAYRFVKQTNPDSFGELEHEGTPRVPANPKDGGDKLDLSTEKMLEQSGVSTETYRKISTKYGDALRGLGFGS